MVIFFIEKPDIGFMDLWGYLSEMGMSQISISVRLVIIVLFPVFQEAIKYLSCSPFIDFLK